MNWEMQICDVCRLLNGDMQPKPCVYCADCNAWICQGDVGNWARRARAMAISKVQQARGWFR